MTLSVCTVRSTRALALVLSFVTSHLFNGPVDARPITLDDILEMESVGAVQTDVHGRRIVFERIPSLSGRRDYALSESRYEAELYLYDTLRQIRPVRLLPDRSVSGEWLGPFSPGGTRLAIYWIEADRVRAGAYDFVTDRLHEFDFTPSLDFAAHWPVWISDHEMVYAAMPTGEQPVRVSYIRTAAARLARAWDQAWSGETSTASVIRSGLDSGVQAPSGALIRVNVVNGRTERLADGNFVSLALSPSGRYLAAVRREGLLRLERQTPVVGVQGPYRYVPYIIDLEKRDGQAVQLCVGCDVMHSSLQWGASGTELAFFSRQVDQPWETATFSLFDILNGTAQAVPHVGLDIVSRRERGAGSVPEIAVPFGAGVAIAARRQVEPDAPPKFSDRAFGDPDRTEIDWYLVTPDGVSHNLTSTLDNVSPVLAAAGRDSLTVVADGRLYRVGKSLTSEVRTAKRDLVLVDPAYDRGAALRSVGVDSFVAQSATDGERYVLTFDSTGRILGRTKTPEGNWRMATASRNGNSIVFRSSSALRIIQKSGEGKTFWKFNHHLRDIEPAREVYVSYRTESGDEFRSCALLPDTWAKGQKAPILVYLYPGAFRTCVRNYQSGIAHPYEPELFAQLGYVVLFPFAPDTKLRNAEGPLGNWASLVEPALLALDQAGYGDRDRAGVFGLSYGAISVLALITQTDQFKAAVASHGAANFASHYGTLGLVRRLLPEYLFAAGQSVSYESKGSFLWLGAVPWENPDRFATASPFFSVDKIHTPILLMHSDLDWNYQMEQFDQIFVALYRLGREAEYVRYWGEGHGLISPANIRDMWGRMAEWYRERLLSTTVSGGADLHSSAIAPR